MGYTRLTLEERYQIEALLGSGLSKRRIAEQLYRSVSCISEEVRRNTSGSKYRAVKAHKLAVTRREHVHRPYKVTGKLERTVRFHLYRQWSPEQISGRLRFSGITVSHETIYQYVYRRFKMGDQCYLNYEKSARRRYSRKVIDNFNRIGFRSNRKWIEERPSIVDERNRLGDFERDTVLGKRNGPVLLTIVDRTSRKLRMKRVNGINAYLTHWTTVSLLSGLKVHSLTNDNGPEFERPERTENELKTKIFFNHPYASWQRGTNENTNGLIRQYYPKGTDLSKVNDDEISVIEQLINNRPRKTLGYRTPNEVERLMNQKGVSLST